MASLALLGGTPVRRTPWPKWPEFGPDEESALVGVLRSGSWGGYPCPNTEARRFQEAFAAYVGTPHAIAAANGTVTLELILRAAKLEAGDEVIVPALTWIATAGAPVYLNGVPVFADVDPETLCIDAASVEALIGPRTRAIILVHLGSAMADLDALKAIADRRGLLLVEDCAHAHGARWRGRHAGSIGHAGSFSFQSSKLMTAGEGGAITTADRALAERCQALVNCGRKEPGYDGFEGPVFGWNDRMTEFQAALLTKQLLRLDGQTARRAKNAEHLGRLLAEIPGLAPQKRDARITQPTYYHYVLRYDRAEWHGLTRDRFVEALEAEGVPASGNFYDPIPERTGELFPLRAAEYPAISARYGSALDASQVSCPVAAKAVREQTVWLPHPLLLGTEKDVEDVVAAIWKIRANLGALGAHQ
jgi:dTDP-4-amino-4,6-dideoxygalactose transaminase